MNKTVKPAEKFKQTISKDLFTAWKAAKRPGDVTKIATSTGMSYPVIQRALKYGYVNNSSLVEQISNYFKNRKDAEGKAAASLIN